MLTALDIKDDTTCQVSLSSDVVTHETITRDGQKGMSQRVKVGNGRRIGVDGGFLSSSLLLRPQRPALPLIVPGLQIIGIGQTPEEIAHIRVGFWAKQYVVVYIPRGLFPGIKQRFLVGMIRMKGRYNALCRVIEKDRANAYRHSEFEMMGYAEKRLVFAYGLTFVVKNGPATSDPARIDCRSSLR